MNARTIPMLIAAALAGLVAGFLLSNAVNRNEIATLRAETEQLKKGGATTPSGNSDQNTLTDEEINATIQRAEVHVREAHGALHLVGTVTEQEDGGAVRVGALDRTRHAIGRRLAECGEHLVLVLDDEGGRAHGPGDVRRLPTRPAGS